jgi:hypothetical protein
MVFGGDIQTLSSARSSHAPGYHNPLRNRLSRHRTRGEIHFHAHNLAIDGVLKTFFNFFMRPIYLPVLKAKGAEFSALKLISSKQRAKIIPLFEIPPVAYNFEAHKPKESLEAHLIDTVSKLKKTWDAPAFVDLPYLSSGELINNDHPITFVLREANRKGLLLIPVMSTDPSRGVEHQREIARLIANGIINRVCLRIRNEDIIPSELPSLLPAIITMLGIKPGCVDLIFDFEHMTGEILPYVLRMKACIKKLPERDSWNSISLVGSGLLTSMSEVEKFAIIKVPRLEWHLWSALATDADCKDILRYGDYAIAAPGVVQFDPRVMRMNAKIWYTSKEAWLLTPGANWKDDTGQYSRLCQLISSHRNFRGEGYSLADERILQCARGEIKGSPQTWLKDGILHHITYVLDQLAMTGEA